MLNTYSRAELARVLRRYGEERFADRIAARIVEERERELFTSSARLVRLLHAAIPAAARSGGGHPAKRTFQALRIEVNGELGALESVLPSAIAALAMGGRVAVLAYHSLEDRLVKQVLGLAAHDRAPRDLPVVPAAAAARAPAADPGCAAADRRRGRGQPPGGVGPAAGGGADPGAGAGMSAVWAGIPEASRPAKRAKLRPVPPPRSRLARIPFLLVLIGIFGLGMAGLLMLNTTLQNQMFQARSLNRQATELAYVEADLQNRLDAAGAPGELARRASLIGMRPNPRPAFLVLPKGKVIGNPTPVTGSEAPDLVIKTRAQLASERATRIAAKKAKAAKEAAKEKAAQQKAEAAKKAKQAKKKKQQDADRGRV